MNRAKKFTLFIVALGIFILLMFGGQIITFYIDWLWFREVGYLSVFTKVLWTKIFLGIWAGIIFFIFAGINIWFARRSVPVFPNLEDIDYRFRKRAGLVMKKGFNWVIFLAILVASAFVCMEASNHWRQYLTFVNATPFGIKDPVFNQDISLYIFRLPFWSYIFSWSLTVIVITAIGVAIVYIADKTIDLVSRTPSVTLGARGHLLFLLSLFLIIKGIGYRLAAYHLLNAQHGTAFGAMYSDLHARLPLMNIMMSACFLAALVILYSIRQKGWKIPAYSVGGLIVISILAGAGYPELVQQIRVKPNEFSMEKPYIQRTIEFTRNAYGIKELKEVQFPGTGTLTASDIERNEATIKNIRLWDYRPLSATYQNLQAIRPYYNLKGPEGIDVDRYKINGESRQIMIAGRELGGTPEIEGSWVRNRLQYTHGYGVVASPANEVSAEGLPTFLLSGIPMGGNSAIPLKEPRIYYGENTDKYVVIDTTQNEFDYPQGEKEASTRYTGKGGIPMGSFFRRALFALRYGDWNLLFPGAIRPSSRIMLRRQISERINTIAPFLKYDRDPYMVISNGRLYWIQDAYTTSAAYPYSEPYQLWDDDYPVNYVRNSVKITVDAYDGTVNFYVTDTQDPVIRTYQKIFPKLFHAFSDMPTDLRAHVRYPEDLFKLQASVFSTYHMTNPAAFYRKEDVWNFPIEVHQDKAPMQPYYVIMKLPGEKQEEFIQILPFTPPNRDNMIAWMAAKCDPHDYGKLIVYHFPELAFGPAQIEARIDQDTVISGQLSLWDQSGSKVIRGNLLVIPIEDSLLYVEPLYLQSTGSQLPELKRVIVAYGRKVVMDNTLNDALSQIFGSSAVSATEKISAAPAKKTAAPTASVGGGQQLKQLAQQANQAYQKALNAQKSGDWAGYGSALKELQSTLNKMQQVSP